MPRQVPYDDARRVAARRLASDQGGVLSRPQLYDLSITRWEIRGQVRGHRWQLIGDQSVQLGNGELSSIGEQWAAVFQGGPRACLDGGSALIAAGLERYAMDRVRVSVPRGARVRRNRRFNIRQTRRWAEGDVVRRGVPRTRTATAAIRAALWARTDREATYVLLLAVQQRLTDATSVGSELLRIRRDRRRLLLHSIVNELLDGAQTLGEVDIAILLRQRGLPSPTRQALRRDRRGHYFLDLYWPAYRLVVEIDGIHHAWIENLVGDALRQNALALDGDTVLRIPLLGLRLQPDDFLDQIEDGLRAGGWAEAARGRREDVIRTEHPLAPSA
jgi:very-short-patch-repair endonuclease